METTKIIEVSITSLRVTAEGQFMKDWLDVWGDSVIDSPHFAFLMGRWSPMAEWMTYRKLPENYISGPLMSVIKSLIKEGQREPIKIYKDMRINTGHKRAAAMLYLGYDKIKAVIVPDDYKL